MEEACQLKLKVIQGAEVGREYDVSFGPMIIGHGLKPPSNWMSPLLYHIVMHCSPLTMTRYLSTNLDGGSRTYIDGVRIAEPTPLHVASRVQIGGQVLEVAAFRRDASALGVSFEIVEGPDVGQVHWVYFKEMIVGRSAAAQIKFADSTGTLSRLHARFNLKNSDVYLTDLGSKNGTYVDGFRIEEPTVVEQGMCIGFSDVICEITSIERV